MYFYLITPMHFLHECIINYKKKLTIRSWIMTLLNKEPVKRVEKLLKEFDANQKVITLESPARTALEAASSLGCEAGSIVKSLLFKAEKEYILGLIAGDKKASLYKIKKILKKKDVSMSSAEEVKNITGFTIGGVSPIGHLKKINILIDSSLKRFNYLYAAAGHPNSVFKISFEDLNKITNSSILDIIEWGNQNS